jgi:peptide/nickel transport system substrate-binding protein
MRKSSSFIMSSAALVALVGLAAGCGSSAASAPPKTGGAAVVALPVDSSPNWFFPIESATTFSIYNSQAAFLMYRPLVYITSADSVDYSRSVASKIVANRAGNQFVITIGHKYKWSDGRPVTAQDVVFTWDIIKAASGSKAPWTYGGAGIGGVPADWTSVKADGTNRVVVTLDKSVNQTWFIHNGLGQIIPVPRFMWDKYGSQWNRELAYIQSVANSPSAKPYSVVDGPYKFSSMQANNNWTFVKNPVYGGHPSSLQKIVFQYETSNASEFTGLKNGTITVGYLPTEFWSAQKDLTQDQLFIQYPFGFNYIVPNLSPKAMNGIGPALNQLYVRQALQMGINQKGIISLNHGYGVVEDTTVPSQPKTIFYDPALSKPLYPYDPAAGKKLLEAHGWREVDGVMTKGHVKLSFPVIYTSGTDLLTNEMSIIKQDWAQEGVQITLDSMPFNNVISTGTAATPSKWDMMNWGGGWTYEPDYYPTGGGLLATNSASNSGDYSNQTMNRLIQASYLPGTPQENLAALFRYEAYARQQVPVLWLPWLANFNVYSKTLTGFPASSNPVTDLVSPNYWVLK